MAYIFSLLKIALGSLKVVILGSLKVVVGKLNQA